MEAKVGFWLYTVEILSMDPLINVYYRPPKDDSYCTRITVGVNLIKYPGEIRKQIADMKMAKLLFNSTISIPDALVMCCNIKHFYPGTPMEHYEYICLSINIIPEEILEQ